MPRITIVYKSGAKVKVRCKSMEVKKTGGKITEIQWDSIRPTPLHIGVDDIAAIYEGKA